MLVDVGSADVLFTETFIELEEGRNKAAYAICPGANRVIAYVKEQTWGKNLAMFDIEKRSCTSIRVCDGSVVHVEFR